MQGRRLEDRAPGVMISATVRGWQPIDNAAHDTVGSAQHAADTRSAGASTNRFPALLLELGSEDLLCICGAELYRLPRRPEQDVALLASSLSESIRERYVVAERKRQFDDRFLLFVEHTNRASSVDEVFDALLHQVPRLMCVHTAILFVASRGTRSGPLRPLTGDPIFIPIKPLKASAVLPRPAPGTIPESETAPGQPFAALAPLWKDAGARQLACVAVGENRLLVLVERRTTRVFTGEDWFRLQTIARHAGRALERLDLLKQSDRHVHR